MDSNKPIAIVLGGYVNGYSIIQELDEAGVREIGLLFYKNQPSSFSNKLVFKRRIEKTEISLLEALFDLKKKYSYLVLFPTDDLQLEQLTQVYDQIKLFCFIPFNVKNILTQSEKLIQYKYCHELGIPYPKTIEVKEDKDILYLSELKRPFIIKPNKREDLKFDLFRNKVIKNEKELIAIKKELPKFLNNKINFIASEIIPGDSSGSIFAYTAYRSKKGEVLNEWTGKKLTQFPDDFGIFASASNQAPKVVKDQGRRLIEAMDITGICEPEFKYDARDGKYKLMEVNLRSMMWHRVGALSGVYLHYSQWLDAQGKSSVLYSQNVSVPIHFSYLNHEIVNLISRKKYFSIFINSLFGGSKNELALYNTNDLLPFLIDLLPMPREILKAIIKRVLSKNRYA